MKFTNEYGLPQPIVDALQGDDFDLASTPQNNLWLTRLLNPPKISMLERRHWDELEVDVSERLALLIGKGVHSEIERHTDHSERLTEEKAYIVFSDMSVRTLPVGARLKDQEWYSEDELYCSCKLDLYATEDGKGVIDDYKSATRWQVLIDKGPKPDQTAQLNVYGWVMRQLEFPVDKLRLTLLLKDWSKTEAKRDHRYPEIPIQCYPVPMWSDSEVVEFVEERVKVHTDAMTLDDDDIPPCTFEERWARKPTFAVMKVGNVKAAKVCQSRGEADIWSAEAAQKSKGKSKFYIQERPGQNARCESYCSVKQFCNFYRDNYSKAAK